MAEPERAPNEAPDPQKCEQIAEWAGSRRFEHIRPEDVGYLKVLVLDSIGCALGALPHQPIQAIRQLTGELGGSDWCTLIGGGRSAPDRAAFFNGALVRYLDFMDIVMVRGQSFHPSDNFAAVLAACEMAGGLRQAVADRAGHCLPGADELQRARATAGQGLRPRDPSRVL